MVINKKTKARSYAKSIRKLAEEIYDEQRDVDTPPAELEDITKLLRMMAVEIERIAGEVKELSDDGE
jgi:hypothetical protein